jgi:acyl carrier protein
VSPRSPVASVGADLVFRRLAERIAEFPAVADPAIGPDTRFDEIGLDSVDRLELLVWIEDEFGVELPAEDLHLPTVGDLVATVGRRREAGQG